LTIFNLFIFLRARIEHQNQRHFRLQQARGFLRHEVQDFLKVVLLAEDGGEVDERLSIVGGAFQANAIRLIFGENFKTAERAN
jgi:hypothetical protein